MTQQTQRPRWLTVVDILRAVDIVVRFLQHFSII